MLGVAPWQYVLQRRVEHAAELLLDPRLTIHAIARTVGMADAAHLTRCFRKRFSCTPGVYRSRFG